MFDWVKELSCAVTVCDTNGVVLYQNDKSKATFSPLGDMVGKNLQQCHRPESWATIQRLIKEETSSTYTIEKKGIKKLIHQIPWYQNGIIGGLVELSIELPQAMPHHIRD